MLKDYRLTLAEILYHLPDHPSLLQSFIWQHLDIAPKFPELNKFLGFWPILEKGDGTPFFLAGWRPRPNP
ncbi:MAG TPA: hypothetical protein EYQ81_17315 [Sneathiellales bacterium]|nr:hypothetical protein [Sneathiellales bacterium]